MGFLGETWQLRDHAGGLLADLIVTDADFPWLTARLESTPAFEVVRPLFIAELAASGVEPGDEAPDWEAADTAYEQIRAATVLHAPGGPVAEFLMHVRGNEAWWRWSDEPFDEQD